jgi:microcompartment protein CcmL/EutN
LSERRPDFDPAIGLLEFESIVAGIVAGDSMAKAAPVSSLFCGTVHPGRYLVLVGGDTAAVEIALEAGGTDTVVDTLFLADVHPAVIEAITATSPGVDLGDEALGVVETTTSATAIIAADLGVKAADVDLAALRLADDLGGKGYCLFTGTVADVEAAVETAVAGTEHRDRVVSSTVIAQLHAEMRDNLSSELRFNSRLRTGDA